MERSKKISLDKVLSGVGKSARRHAFRNNQPVAISENGTAILLYPDGTRKKITAKVLQELTNGNA